MVLAASLAVVLGGVNLPQPSPAAAQHVLRVGGPEVGHLNTLLITTYPELWPAQLTAGYLTRLDASRRPVPDLALEVPSHANGGISNDGRAITFRLRTGLRWSDGQPLTAADVVFTTHLIIAKASPVADRSDWDQIVDVTRVGADGVRFRLAKPYGPAIFFFSSYRGYSILPQHLLADTDLRTAPFNALPVGAGPFRYVSFRRGDVIGMERNPYYNGARPLLDRVDYHIIPDENTLTTQLLTGEVDLALAVRSEQWPRVTGVASLRELRMPSGNTSFVGFNTTRPPLDDQRVRHALRLAFDRGVLIDKLYHGRGTFSDDPVTPLDPYLGASIPTERPDLLRAGQLLDAAGWKLAADGKRYKNGTPLTIDTIVFTGNTIATRVVELLRPQWAAAGISLSERTLDASMVFASGGPAARGDFTAMLWGSRVLSEDLTSVYGCAGRPPNGFNYPRLCDARVDAAIAAGDTSYDPAFRMRAYVRARKAIAEDVPVIVSAHPEDDDVMNVRVQGFSPNGFTFFDDVSQLDTR